MKPLMDTARLAPVPTAHSCPICSGSTKTRFRDLHDDRYGFPGFFSLEACAACGHQHVPAQFTPAELSRLYTLYYPRREFPIDTFKPETETRGLASWLRGDRASAFRWVPRNVRVLDIGCGSGQALAYHALRGCEAVGVETDENVGPIAKRFGLDIRLGTFDGSDFSRDYFDWVTLDQVAEHVTNPHALMRGVARVLKPGGVVVASTPNPDGLGARLYGRRWLNWHVPYHLQFYSIRSLGLVATSAGLHLQSSKTVTASDWQYYQWLHLMTFPEPGEKSAFWAPGGGPRRLRYRANQMAALARRLRIHQAWTRITDFASAGDCRVFILTKP